MNRFKILFNTYPVAFQKKGGGEKQIDQYFKYLLEKKIIVEKFDQWSEKQKVENFDIVHFFSVIPGGAINFLRYAKNQNKKIIISPNIWLEDSSHNEFNQIKYILHLADIIIVNSKIEQEKLSTLFQINIEKLKVVYNFVDDDYLEIKTKKNFCKKFNIQKPYILTVGNVEERKNQNSIIRILKDHPGLNFVNIGNIRDKRYLNNFPIEKNKIYLIEYLEDKELIKSAYLESDLFILPSLCETPSIAALEAAALGKKIVITEVGSTKEYFGKYASYIKPLDDNSINSELKKNIKIKETKTLSTHIQKNFNSKNQMTKLIKIYKNLYENSH
tara:strand:- start:1374 stop:2363 length:990 start_codon:yes stop_codon:yes gene_type:complete